MYSTKIKKTREETVYLVRQIDQIKYNQIIIQNSMVWIMKYLWLFQLISRVVKIPDLENRIYGYEF